MSAHRAALAFAAFEDKDLEAAAAHAQAALDGGYGPIRQLAAVIAYQRRDYATAIRLLESLDGAGDAAVSLLIRLHLLAGDVRRGGQLLLDCCRADAFGPPLHPVPRWTGEPLAGKSVVAWGGGYGDDILYARFVSMLAERTGAEVTLQCRPALVRLFRSLSGVARVLPLDADVPESDYQVQTAEVAALYGLLQGETWSGPYLHADPRPLPSGGLKVGLVWASAAAHWEVGDKSAALAAMAPLAQVPGVRLYSLQVGAPRTQLSPPPTGMAVEDLAGGLRDFADTAAAIAGLDLVVAIDTAVANLAGAMGAAVWVAAPFIPDWRWGRDGDRTPWFPTARVYRQAGPGDWRGVFEAMAADLAALVEAGR
ncbi:hypothetical protein T8K17_15630 [Thalassobaculum sp. OXR-137]|uniref:hypothetical protein n=1 Tax=Thalassobaculum sp. OXR-137 TaxID=3100173 RepID=UPI002AC95C93|nr:hypothetical protein [Thalassobaculum sp. OXR-137]WPZ32670.1 hypothetical protein T8K17_15630 [Thalassobaculum sp. OXR-137]